MIRRAQNLGYKVNVYAPGNSEALLKYGTIYYSYVNDEKSYNKEIVFHFPESPVNVKKLKVTVREDIFVNNWEIKVSKDNETYETLKHSNEPFCKEKYTVASGKRFGCSTKDTNIFNISNREDQHAYFVKFVMISNTWNEAGGHYENLMTFLGFELIGDLYVKYRMCACQKKYQISKCFILLSFMISS